MHPAGWAAQETSLSTGIGEPGTVEKKYEVSSSFAVCLSQGEERHLLIVRRFPAPLWPNESPGQTKRIARIYH